MVLIEPRALLDTSIVIDPPHNLAELVREAAISTITLAELAYGLNTPDPMTNAERGLRYQRILNTFDPIPYSTSAAALYGALCAAVRSQGRSPKPRRFDLLLASVAAAEGIPLLTRNPDDFKGIDRSVRIVAVPPTS